MREPKFKNVKEEVIWLRKQVAAIKEINKTLNEELEQIDNELIVKKATLIANGK